MGGGGADFLGVYIVYGRFPGGHCCFTSISVKSYQCQEGVGGESQWGRGREFQGGWYGITWGGGCHPWMFQN